MGHSEGNMVYVLVDHGDYEWMADQLYVHDISAIFGILILSPMTMNYTRSQLNIYFVIGLSSIYIKLFHSLITTTLLLMVQPCHQLQL